MYVIGDRELLFEIPHAFLRRAHEAAEGNHFRYRRVAIATAEGFLLPVQRAHLLAARVIEIAKAVEAPAPVPSLGACSNCHESPATIEHETERLCRPCDLAIYPEAAEE
jgi:hypothetical protein